MTKLYCNEYSNLKKNINTYIDKFPSPNQKINKDRLERLINLKPFIDTDKKKAKEYFKLREKITLSNGGFAMKYVMRYYVLLNDESAIGELFQEATIGLIESIDTFDMDKKVSFTTYAFYHVRKRIIDFIKYNKLVRAPRDIARNMKHVSEIQSLLYTRLQREPNLIEISNGLNKIKGIQLKDDTITNIMKLLDLNSSNYNESFLTEFTDQISTDEETDLFKKIEINIMNEISKFPEKIQKAIKLRFGLEKKYPHSPEEVKLLLDLTDEELESIIKI